MERSAKNILATLKVDESRRLEDLGGAFCTDSDQHLVSTSALLSTSSQRECSFELFTLIKLYKPLFYN